MEAMQAAEQLREAGLHSDEAADLIETIARNSTHGAGDRVVLGEWVDPAKWTDESGGYIREAVENGGVYYETPPHLYDALGRNSDLAWPANEQFLRTQLQEGKTIEYSGISGGPQFRARTSFRYRK
jgi:hypothetical protein